MKKMTFDFHLELRRWGCGQKLGLISQHKAEAFTVFDQAQPQECQENQTIGLG
jgi:hypothetical protein